ncbi:hypothetical protein QF046_001412 [Microbacterium sp. W4I4]|uniref:hypothetical protein n=1 Tax=Microbacterium sp. W4I4 TaxID=3042295 RepID=UPI0027838C85|nr:hypothetical protein [Microbacterium sp. W4I4]MDQ0613771.1 hypothetical protein [Microbacterium sp. W4I4]
MTRIHEADVMETSPPRRDEIDGRVRVTTDVGGRAPLWFSVDELFGDLVSDRADHVLIALLMPAMKEGLDLHVGGTVSDSLLHYANADLQRLLRMEHPDLSVIQVTADAPVAPAPRAAGVATGFSGGVDSFSSLAEYLWGDDVPQSLRVTHLLNNNVGAHGHGSIADELWHRRREPLARIADELGLPFVTVDSNLDEHYPRIGFIESVTMRNAAVPHLLGAGIGHLHLASAIPFPYVRVDDTGEIARIDTMLVPLLSTAAVTIASANSGLTRVQKTLSLIGRPESQHLDVCTDGDPARTRNCSACSKCMRTMLTFEIAGHLQEYCPGTFSYERYAERRDAFVAKVLSSDDPYHREIRAYATEVGWQWDAADRRRAALEAARTAASRAIRSAARMPLLRSLRQRLKG